MVHLENQHRASKEQVRGEILHKGALASAVGTKVWVAKLNTAGSIVTEQEPGDSTSTMLWLPIKWMGHKHLVEERAKT